MVRGPYQRLLRNGISQFALMALLWAAPAYGYNNPPPSAQTPLELEYAPSAGSTSPTPEPTPAPRAVTRSKTTPRKAVATTASVRVGEHRGFGRIVFAVGSKAAFEIVSVNDSTLRINISRGLRLNEQRLQRISLAQLDKAVLVEEENRQSVLLTLKPGTSWTQFRTEDGFGLDLRTDVKVAAKEPAKLEDKKPEPPVALAAELTPPPSDPAEEAPEVAVKDPILPPVETPAAPVIAEAPHQEPSLPPVEAAPAPVAGVPSVFQGEPMPPVSPAPAVAAGPLISALPPPSVLPEMRVTLPAGSGLAVAQRNNTLFIAVPGAEPNDVSALVGPELAAQGQVKLIKTNGQGRVVAIQLPALQVYPTMTATATGWNISFPSQPTSPSQPVAIERQPDFALGARVLVKALGSSQPISFIDPVVGDVLTLVPTTTAQAGVATSYRVPQAELMPSYQGVLIRNLADTLAVVGTANGVEISAAGGLQLAEALPGDALQPQNGVTLSTPVALDMPPLFDFDKWARYRQANFTRERQRLNDAIVAAQPPTRDVPRIDLARFYFMRGMPVEAAGLWAVVGEDNPSLANRPEYHLMNAIGQMTTGDFAKAATELAAVSQPTNDAALWRGYLAAQNREWATAAEQFRPAIARLQDYPEPYYSRLAMAAIETFDKTDDDGLARDVLAMLTTRQQAELKQVAPGTEYLAGMLNSASPDLARKHFNSAAGAWQQYWRVRAELALVEADLKDGKIPLEEAVHRYERLRFAWRGDALEFDIVQRLAHLHIENNRYAEAFEDYDLLARKFPDDPRTAGLETEKRVAFRDLFLGPPAQKVPARVQIAVWNRYADLRPADKTEVLNMQRALAERTASIDLLDQASNLLTDVLASEQSPVERARLGARIAGLKLLDGYYEAALAALNQTEPTGEDSKPATPLPEDVAQERKYLRAQTFSGLNQVEPALALLANDDSETARRLKVDITWRAKRWSEAAAAIMPFIGSLPTDGKLSDLQRGLIVRRATALALAGDTGGLAAMRVQYASLMDSTVDGPTFQLLTRPDGDSALADAATLGKRVAEVDLFSDFLSRYRSGDKPVEPQTN